MVVGLGTETNFLDHHLGGFLFLFLLAFFLLVQELLVVEHAAHRGLGGGRDFDEVEAFFAGDAERLVYGIDTLLYVVTHEAHLTGAYALVCCVGVFAVTVAGALTLSGTRAGAAGTSGTAE